MGFHPPNDNVTRRRLLHCSAAGLAFAPFLAAAQNQPLPADTQKIATENDLARRLTVAVTINGHGPYNFVLDTGADRTVLADDIAVSLGLPRGKQIMVQGVVRTLPSQTVTVGNLAVGSVRREHLEIPVLPRSVMQADGYLGLDVIDDYRVTLDFQNHVLEIGEGRPFSSIFYPANSLRIPVYGRDGHLRSIDCRVGGIRTTAFLDTGAEVSVGNSQLFNALYDRDPGYGKVGAVTLSGVTGGAMDGGVTLVDRIELKELAFSNCTLVIADLQIFDIWGLAEKPALMIGMNYLRQFAKVSVDYSSKELRFDLARLDDSMIAMRG